MAEEELERSELEALLETRRELGLRYDRELVDGFADRIERAVEARYAADKNDMAWDRRASEHAGQRQLALGIVSVVVGIPTSAITLAIPEGNTSFGGAVRRLGGHHRRQLRARAPGPPEPPLTRRTPERRGRPEPAPPQDAAQSRASISRLYAVAAATRAEVKPASANAAVSLAGPAWAPRAAPPCETLFGTQSSELAT